MGRGMKKNINMVVAGHLCLDITPEFPDRTLDLAGDIFLPGKLTRVGAADTHIGGAVANTGLALKFLGADVVLMGKVGKDAFGEIVGAALKEHGAEEGLIVSEDAATSYSIVLAPKGVDRIFLHHPGANDAFYVKDMDFDKIGQADLFHFGYPPLMASMFERDGEELVSMFREVKKRKVVTSLDMAAVDANSPAGRADWEEILKRVLPFVDFFVPSVEELAYMIDRSRFEEWQQRAAGKDICTILDVERDIRPLAEKLIGMGAKVVLIKCGLAGLYLAAGDEVRLRELDPILTGDVESWANVRALEPCFVPARVKSGTGAGDTSIAGFLYAVFTGHTYEESLQLAAAMGASCVEEYDALSGLKTFDVLKEKIRNGWEKRKE